MAGLETEKFSEDLMTFNLEAFHRVLDPADNATGGGAASAVSGAMGASLVAMVARLSKGRDLALPDSLYEQIDQDARGLAERLMRASNEDSKAFDKVMAAFRMPKSTDEEKAARSAAIQAGWAGATETPLQTAEACGRVLELAAGLRDSFNQNAASDLDCAEYLAQAGMKGALSNAEINIATLKDPAVAEAFKVRIQKLKETGEK